MRRELAAIYDELLRLQASGARDLYLSDESLQLLREAASDRQAEVRSSRGLTDERELARQLKKLLEQSGASPSEKAVTNPSQEMPEPPRVALPEGDKILRLAALREQVLSDSWCRSQVKPGKQVVFGVGNPDARIFFCGEAPGAEEEVQGEPFVGPAGQLLTRIIQAMGLSREGVYIANILNYRPPIEAVAGNRPPSQEEMRYCLPYLLSQLEIVQPDVIVALGRTAMDGLKGYDPKRKMTRSRGHWTDFNGIPLMPTYHPSYLLRQSDLGTKRKVWEDMLAVMEKVGMPISEKQRGFFLK